MSLVGPDTPIVSAEECDKLVGFREDLRPPAVGIGRCSVTGEFAKCVAIDLGDSSIVVPDFEKPIFLDEVSGDISFEEKTLVWQSALSVSVVGLKKLLEILENAPDEIITITPHLDYAWEVVYRDGAAERQFYTEPETGDEKEVRWGDLRHSDIINVKLVPHYIEDIERLPVYVFSCETGKFYKGSEELDVRYQGEYPEDRPEVIYGRKNYHTMASACDTDPNKFLRTLDLLSSDVLQVLGWAVGGREGQGPRCVIAVDPDGMWRPWDYRA